MHTEERPSAALRLSHFSADWQPPLIQLPAWLTCLNYELLLCRHFLSCFLRGATHFVVLPSPPCALFTFFVQFKSTEVQGGTGRWNSTRQLLGLVFAFGPQCRGTAGIEGVRRGGGFFYNKADKVACGICRIWKENHEEQKAAAGAGAIVVWGDWEGGWSQVCGRVIWGEVGSGVSCLCCVIPRKMHKGTQPVSSYDEVAALNRSVSTCMTPAIVHKK